MERATDAALCYPVMTNVSADDRNAEPLRLFDHTREGDLTPPGSKAAPEQTSDSWPGFSPTFVNVHTTSSVPCRRASGQAGSVGLA